jgi:hypothetical protein
VPDAVRLTFSLFAKFGWSGFSAICGLWMKSGRTTDDPPECASDFERGRRSAYQASQSFEKDLPRRRSLRTGQDARTAVFDYIEAFYNRERLRPTLGYRPLAEYEQDHHERSDCVRSDETIFIEEQAKAA